MEAGAYLISIAEIADSIQQIGKQLFFDIIWGNDSLHLFDLHS